MGFLFHLIRGRRSGTALTKFMIRLLLALVLGFALFTSVDLATAARLRWWDFTFMWGFLLMAGLVVGGIWSVTSSR
jgi:hypothetical protein